MRPSFNDALRIAINAHDGQYDKGGQPYILHPLNVSEMVFYWDEQIVALLHDVIEDSNYTIDDISKILYGIVENTEYEYEWQREVSHDKEVSEVKRMVDAIDAISKRKDEKYEDYITRLSGNKLALIVKIADMKHNSDLTRISEDNRDKYQSLIKKYEKWLPVLEGQLERYEKYTDNLARCCVEPHMCFYVDYPKWDAGGFCC